MCLWKSVDQKHFLPFLFRYWPWYSVHTAGNIGCSRNISSKDGSHQSQWKDDKYDNTSNSYLWCAKSTKALLTSGLITCMKNRTLKHCAFTIIPLKNKNNHNQPTPPPPPHKQKKQNIVKSNNHNWNQEYCIISLKTDLFTKLRDSWSGFSLRW